MTKVEELLKDYLDYLEIEKNRSPKTRQNYERYLKAFFASEGVKSVGDLSLENIKNFRLALARKEGLKKVTQNYYVIAIRNFLKYLIKKDVDVVAPDKIELPKVPSRQIELVEVEELDRLLASPKLDSIRGLRDKAILELLFSTGLRLAELCKLDRYLNFDRGEVTVRGKGEKLRLVFVSETAQDAIKNYLDKRPDTENKLFVSLDKKGKVVGPITPRSVQRMVNFYSRKAGITTKLTPHGLRHLFATDLLRNGADIRSVQELLGHASISTTQIYTHVTNKHLKEIHKTFHDRKGRG